jgi:hypothetical protein
MSRTVGAVCNACGDNHTMGTTVSLPGELVKQSISRAFLVMILLQYSRAKHQVVLSKLGRRYTQKDDKKIFLVRGSLKGLHYLEAFFDIGSSSRVF